ncbi:hypothetical protein GOODEAATRI_005469 [Goodea atripinnis]|uniref:Uncharacterized protein n=1 Tax=Goodea atripinnis TaxID=208336 RepID=A0ABV0NBF3_9TELE
MTLLLEPHSQGKTKTPAPSKGAPWQRWRARNKREKGKQGNRRPALGNICTAFLHKKNKSCIKNKKIKPNTVCMSPRGSTKTWEGCVLFFFFIRTLSACLFPPTL